MKVVVADASPINYLVLIGEVGLLARLYGEVLIPDICGSRIERFGRAAVSSAMGDSASAMD